MMNLESAISDVVEARQFVALLFSVSRPGLKVNGTKYSKKKIKTETVLTVPRLLVNDYLAERHLPNRHISNKMFGRRGNALSIDIE